MTDTLTATPLPALGLVRLLVDFGLNWQALNSNPTFETSTAGWAATGGTITRSTAQAHEGVASMLVTPSGAASVTEATTSNYATVTPGAPYQLSMWVRCAVARNVDVYAVWFNGTTETGDSRITVAVPANTWTPIQTVVTPPSGTVQARLAVAMNSTPPNTHLLYVDEATFSSASVADNLPVQDSNLVHVYRVTPDGTEHEIIGSPVLLSDGQALLYDTTAPMDTNIFYRAVVDTPDVLRDTFSRTVTNGWGTADSWTTWSVDGGASTQFSTNGATGVHRVAALGTLYRVRANVPAVADVNFTTTVTLGAGPTGDYIRSNMYFRRVDGNNSYLLQARFYNGGAIQMWISKLVGAVETQLTTTYTFPQPFYTPGLGMNLQVEAVGTTLRARGWIAGTTVPDWQIAANDATFTSGDLAIGTVFSSLNTNPLPYNVGYDNVVAYSPSPIGLVSNTVQLVAGRDGWVRDPQNPALSVRLDNCASHTFSCLDASNFVFFQGLEEEEYDSATGVFEVVNAEDPVTVAQARKSASTALRLVSTTLEDIPRLKQLFASGRDLSLSLPADYGWAVERYGTAPFTAGTVTVGRLNQRDMRKPQRRWSVPVRVTSADETYPTGAQGSNNVPAPGATYQDMTATGLTYGALAALGATYIEWSQGVYS